MDEMNNMQSNNFDSNQMIDMSDNLPTLSEQIDSTNKNLDNPVEQNNSKETSALEETPKEDSEKMDKVENKSEEEAKKDVESSSSYIDKLLCIFSFIRPYYKVTFNDIKLRIKSSFNPLKNDFMEIADKNPDLYGPFWIYTTLIYVLAAGGALSYYFTDSDNNYFQMFVPVASSILYSFGFGFPFALWLCMKLFKVEMKYVSLICLYGYSLFCLIPVLILCSTGFGWIQWIFLIYGIANSTAFVLINLWDKIRALEEKNKYIFLGIFAGGQFILFLILKFYFFGSFKSKSEAPISKTSTP